MILQSRTGWCLCTCALLASSVFGSPIRLGMSAAFTGPTASVGLAARAGVEAALEEANEAGGIQGRQLELIALDDAYEPSQTGPNMKRLIEDHQVLAVVCNVGAPCAVVAVPIAQEHQTVLYGYITGGAVLRKNPPDSHVFNFRPGLDEEISALLEGMVRQQGIAPEDIAFFTQQDAFGDFSYTAGVETLRRLGLSRNTQALQVRYPRNTSQIEQGLSQLLLMERPPAAVIFAGATQPLLAFIKASESADYHPIVGTVSFVDAPRVAESLTGSCTRIIISQVVPPPFSDLPIAQRFQQRMAVREGEFSKSYIAFEAYTATHLFLAALRQAPRIDGRESVRAILDNLPPTDIGFASPLDFTDGTQQASRRIWMTRIEGGQVLPFDWNQPLSEP